MSKKPVVLGAGADVLLAQVLQQNLQNHATEQQEMKIFHCYHSDEHNWDLAEIIGHYH